MWNKVKDNIHCQVDYIIVQCITVLVIIYKPNLSINFIFILQVLLLFYYYGVYYFTFYINYVIYFISSLYTLIFKYTY